ncbi:MAG: helix-turn-helix domain-containing protein [Chloroflexi bacterium]|nr:helix-turn-helix domain-containing protein [Chloroflexota bacterium]
MNISPRSVARKRKLDFAISMPDLAEFMTTQEAAKKLGFNVKSIPMMLRNKTLDGIRFGRAWLVSKKSVQEYLSKTKGMSKNDPRRKTPK